MKIGFFDSGLGGLLILKATTAAMPEYDYEFYGDTAHLPYGNRPEEEIQELTKIGIEHLFERGCLLVVVACNTASADTVRHLQDTMLVGDYAERRILGVIVPTVEVAIKRGLNHVALLATKRTVESGKYEREFVRQGSDAKVDALALPELVPLIEAGRWAEAERVIETAARQVMATGAEGIILGCTHYSVLKKKVRELVGGRGEVFSQDEIIPTRLTDYLQRHSEISKRLSRDGTRNIYLTDNQSQYDDTVGHLLGGVLVRD